MNRPFLLFALLLVSVLLPLAAEVQLAEIFADNMVLQREKPVPVWGWAAPGESVQVSFADQHQFATTDSKGAWKITLNPMPATAQPQALTVTGANTVTVQNVLVGDVWLCAGQSNMQAWVAGTDTNGLVVSANIPSLRIFLVDVTSTDKPQQKFRQGTPGGINAPQRDKMTQYGLKWTPSTQIAAPWYSSVTYAFGRALKRETGVPTGLITDSLGGTVAEAWTPRDALESNSDLRSYLNDFHGAPTDAKAPGSLYNGAVAPLVPFALKGIVWYQGESNADSFEDASRYRTLFPALIGAWRKSWGEDLPFIFVQLPAFGPMLPDPSDAPWAWLRESQLLTLQNTARTGMAVAIDTGSTTNLHPPTKLPIGSRLAQAALALVYQKPVEPSGPIYQRMTVQGDTIEVRFRNVGSGLTGKEVSDDDGKNHVPADPLRGFAICGADQKFVWADAKITGKDTVRVSGPQVSSPQAVRYAWAAYPACNLYSVEGLPASPFRTDAYKLPQP